MNSIQQRATIVAGCTVVTAMLLLTLISPRRSFGFAWTEIWIGLVVATVFGQTTLAAAWNALGPAPLLWRLPLSLAWVVALDAAFCFRITLEDGDSYALSIFVMLGGCLLGQWLLVQAPLWCFVLTSGWQLRQREDDAPGRPPATAFRQFGIRQLMILTAIVAVLLGLGRAAVLAWAPHIELASQDSVMSAFLGAAAVVTTLPLVIAALLPRGAVVASLVILVLIAAATLGEVPLFEVFHGPRGGPNKLLMFGAINAFTAAWICLVIAGIRLSGYGLDSVTKR